MVRGCSFFFRSEFCPISMATNPRLNFCQAYGAPAFWTFFKIINFFFRNRRNVFRLSPVILYREQQMAKRRNTQALGSHASLLILLTILSCDSFNEDFIEPENQDSFSQMEYYIVPGSSTVIDLASVINQSFQVFSVPAGSGQLKIRFTDVTIVCAYNTYTIFRTTDGSESWTRAFGSDYGINVAVIPGDIVTINFTRARAFVKAYSGSVISSSFQPFFIGIVYTLGRGFIYSLFGK
jgi:hypothetical protein